MSVTRRLATALLASTFALASLGCTSVVQDGTNLKLAHTLNADHPVHKAMVFMGERLDELSGGEMSVQIYPNGQLGSERELVELLQIGSVSMTKVSTISMEGFSDEMKLFSIPYLFEDSDHYWRVLNSDVGQGLLDTLRDVRIQGLGYYDAGSRSFYMTDAPINTPADLKGKKVRVLPSPTSIATVNALGASATPISWGELYTALQQGIVEGAENNPPSYFLSKHYETAKYYTLDEHTSVPDLMIMSQRVYDNLSDQEEAWLKQAMAESVVYQRKLWDEASTDAIEKVKAAGVQVIYPDKAPFREAVKDVRAEFEKGELAPLIRRVEALNGANYRATLGLEGEE
ncbi:TRAP transporter substrate-binding protein [Litorimonas sp. RW-G-Af-16]|uniref:TRAP transporter substrate-binding protein n=1 Tax=Litorimonas sp. RW-G-Af-16 TaxID=3241168 RepID=UPI00390C53BD